MRKLRGKLLFGLLLIAVLSCGKEKKMRTIFETNSREYWKYENACGGGRGIYFKFNNDGTYDKFNRFTDDGFVLFNNDGDLISGKRSWSIKNHSIFIWDDKEYKIEKTNVEHIILSYQKDKKCLITLSKVK